MLTARTGAPIGDNFGMGFSKGDDVRTEQSALVEQGRQLCASRFNLSNDYLLCASTAKCPPYWRWRGQDWEDVPLAAPLCGLACSVPALVGSSSSSSHSFQALRVTPLRLLSLRVSLSPTPYAALLCSQRREAQRQRQDQHRLPGLKIANPPSHPAVLTESSCSAILIHITRTIAIC